jgi:hypothetical protein
MAKRYGASVYATIRRYVSHNDKTCAVLVLNPAEAAAQMGYFCSVRRVVTSPEFARRFSQMTWPQTVSPDDVLGRLVPVNRMTGPRSLRLTDSNGDPHDFIAEAFKTPHQTFILINSVAKPIRRIIMPPHLAF